MNKTKNHYDVFVKLTLREIAKNWFQYLSMIIITMLAVTLFCGFISNAKTLEELVDKYKKDSNLSDLCVQVTNVDSDDVLFFEELCADNEYEYRFYSEGTINEKSAKIYVGQGNITKPLVTEGERGVLIDSKIAKNYSYKLGDIISVKINDNYYEFSITGFMNFIEVANTYSVFPVYIDEEVFMSTLGLPASYINNLYNQILIKTNDVEGFKTDIQSYYQSKETNNLLFVFDADSFEAVVSLQSEVSQSLKMIYVFPVIFLLVSVLIILTTISQLILRERTNIGTLKGLGISNARILVHYSSFGIVLCLIGGIIGVVIGPLIVSNAMMIKYKLVYSLPTMNGVVYSPVWSIVAILIVSLLAGIIGLCVAKSVMTEKPAECMRPLVPKENAIIKKAVGKSEKKNDKFKSSVALSFKMALRNIFIKPSRAIMTIIGIAGCVALLACSFGIGDTVNNSIETELYVNYKYDVSFSYSSENEENVFNELNSLKASGQITEYETYRSFYMTAKGESVKDVYVYCYNSNSSFTKLDVSGGKVLVSKSVAEDLGIKEGDEVLLSYGSNTKTLIVSKLVSTVVTNGIFLDTNEFDEYYHTNSVWISTSNQETIAEYIRDNIEGVNNVSAVKEMDEKISNAISSIDTIKITLMAFAIALSVVVLYNLSLLNIKERNRDIATMKVLGFSNSLISSTLLFEIMILAVIGTLLGLLLGFPILYLVMNINQIEVINFLCFIKPLSYLYSTLISVVTALLINLLFTGVIRKINMIDSLKSVE